MAIELITGRAGKAHIGSEDDRAYHAYTNGEGRYILNGGTASIESANNVHVDPVEFLVDGAHVRVTGAGEDVAIENGVASYKRIDVIALHYTRTGNEDNYVESVEFAVVKGVNVELGSTPQVPSMPKSGTILTGADDVYVPVYSLLVDGLTPKNLTTLLKKYALPVAHGGTGAVTAVEALKALGAFGPGESIPKSTDLNNLTEQGFYYCADKNAADTMKNVPPAIGSERAGFLLFNMKPYGTDVDNVGSNGVYNSYKIAQIALVGSSLLPVIRFQIGRTEWTEWHKCLTTETVMTPLWSGSLQGGTITVDLLDYMVFAALTKSGQYLIGFRNGNDIRFHSAIAGNEPINIIFATWWAQYVDASKSLLFVNYRESGLVNPKVTSTVTITRIYGIA